MGKAIHKIKVGEDGEAIVDTQDADLVRQYRWHFGGTKRQYAASSVGRSVVYLHRLVMGAADGDIVDHVDGNPLNNRRANLRLATRSQNAANRTETHNKFGFRGVVYHPTKKRFQARLTFEGGTFRGPYRRSAETAAEDYDKIARGVFGKFGTYNYPQPDERGVIPTIKGGRDE